MMRETIGRERTRWRGAAHVEGRNGRYGALPAEINPAEFGFGGAPAPRPAGYVAIVAGRPGGYRVVLPDLPACTAGGETIDAALADAAQVVRHWCEAARDRGEALPEPRSAEDAVHGDPELTKLLRQDSALALVPLLPDAPLAKTIELTLDADLVAAVDATAAASGLDRLAFIEDALKAALARQIDESVE
ncbi:type II toxin-antitoxin system HicB family antitoxin [Blastochloris sulfoviridis]|nr:type II toxin-antitoxin system HicB family antitoxin [Blastochloris sulfoviridis]